MAEGPAGQYVTAPLLAIVEIIIDAPGFIDHQLVGGVQTGADCRAEYIQQIQDHHMQAGVQGKKRLPQGPGSRRMTIAEAGAQYEHGGKIRPGPVYKIRPADLV